MTDPVFSAGWVGRCHTRSDVVTAAPAAGLAALLDRSDAPSADGDPLPWPWHWLYFLPLDAQAALGADGHPAAGELLPPPPLPRRMWAGGRLRFARPLHIGDRIDRVSTISDVRSSEGRSGPLVFVTVQHEITAANTLLVTEEQDLVYRERPGLPAVAAPALAPPEGAQFTRTVQPDPTLLFRYAALTFNAHRIHYDRPYATGVEGYPGLVVQGPLVATLLLELLHAHGPAKALLSFDFKAQAPLFDSEPFTLCGRMDDGAAATLWACSRAGSLAMRAVARFA